MTRACLRRLLKVGLGAMLPILLLSVGTAAASATGSHEVHAERAYRAGTYRGQVKQVSPKPYTGKVHFVVRNRRITNLTFTIGAQCGKSLWIVDRDTSVGSLSIKVPPSGAFSFRGTVNQRKIRFKGLLKGHTAHGTLFQSFPWGALTCSTVKPAPFTATR